MSRNAIKAIFAAVLAACLAAPATAYAAEAADTVEDNTQRYSWSQTKECWPDDLEATIASFPAATQIDDGAYHGEIPLVGIEQVPVTAVHEYETNQIAVFGGLPSNDVAQIPEAMGFTVDSGNYAELALAGVSWEVEEADEHGLPVSYAAFCTYRGVDAVEVLDHYEVTARYDGAVEGPVTETRVETREVSERRQVIEVADADNALAPQAEPDGEGDAPGIPWPLVAGLAALGAAGVAATARKLLLLWWWRNRFVVTQSIDGKERTVARCRIDVIDDVMCTEVPAHVNLAAEDEIRGYVPKRHVDIGRECRVLYEGAGVIYSGPAAPVIGLNQRGMVL